MTERLASPDPEDWEKFEIELQAIFDAVQYRHHNWRDINAATRPERPYNLDLDDLYPGQKITLLNTTYQGEDRLRYARHYVIVGEPFKEVVAYPGIESMFVAAVIVNNHVKSEPISSVNDGICDVPLSHLGITKDPITDLFDTSAYAVLYSAISDDWDLVLKH
jgi:hypothetical protein